MYTEMFANENHGNDSDFPVHLTNDNQIYERSRSQIFHQLQNDDTFVFNNIHDEDQVASQCNSQLKVKNEEEIFFEISSNHTFVPTLPLNFQISLDCRAVNQVLDIEKSICLDNNRLSNTLGINLCR
jgi:hypothetical protein